MSSRRRRLELRPKGTEGPQFVSRARISNGRKKPLRWVDLEQSHSRLRELYAIGKILTRFGSVETTFRAVAGIVRQTLALRSAIFILDTGRSRRILIWHAHGVETSALQDAKSNARTSYGYLAGAPDAAWSKAHSGGRITALQAMDPSDSMVAILLPLAVQGRPILGALQIERQKRFDESDLMFVNAVVNALAVALDRHSLLSQQERASAPSAADGREDLLATAAHDLKNPLSVILMAISGLERSLEAPDRTAASGQVSNDQALSRADACPDS